MKAIRVFYHDDPPCKDPLSAGYCKACGFTPDMQSLAMELQCPQCKLVIPYKTKFCGRCKEYYD
jgi:hypothetical protein